MKPDFASHSKPLLKPSARWTVLAAIVSAFALGGVTLRYVLGFQQNSTTVADPPTHSPNIHAVSALGYLQPEGDVIYLSAPLSPEGAGSRVAELLVEEGDTVEAGQIVAVLDNAEALQAALMQAEQEVAVAQANLASVRAGAQTGELNAQSAAIAQLEAELQGQLAAQSQVITRLEAALNNARTEYRRYENLFEEGAIAESQLDSQELHMITVQEQLNEAAVHRNRIEITIQEQIRSAEATLNQIAEVRPTDLQVAQAEVDRALAHVTKAQAELDLSYVRSPVAGRVLSVYTRTGEVVSDRGVVALGQTHQMNVIAEVYELDINNVQVGQRATMTSHAFPGELHGTVTRIGLQINPQNILSTDPAADVDRRVVEVKIRLDPDDSERVSSLTNLQVNVLIDRSL